MLYEVQEVFPSTLSFLSLHPFPCFLLLLRSCVLLLLLVLYSLLNPGLKKLVKDCLVLMLLEFIQNFEMSM